MDYLHGKTQALLLAFFAATRETLPFHPCGQTTMELGEGRYLAPDVAVFYPQEPVKRIPDSPPLIVVEILSPEDTRAALDEQLAAYRAWGVKNIFVVDPDTRSLYRYDPGFTEVGTLTVPELGIVVTPEEIF
jgi:Uma2 family endonuclease